MLKPKVIRFVNQLSLGKFLLLINLFILIGHTRCELNANGKNLVDSDSSKKIAPDFLDSIEGAEFLAQVALYKYTRSDTNLQGQEYDGFPKTSASGESRGSSNFNNQFLENLSSISEVYNKAINDTETSVLSNFKTLCNRPQNPEPGINEYNSLCNILIDNKCLSSDQLLKILKNFSLKSDSLSLSQAIARVCPLMLFQNQQKSCSSEKSSQTLKEDEIDQTTEPPTIDQPGSLIRAKPSASSVWGFGFLFVTIVSCCSLVGVGLLPLFSKKVYHTVLVLFEGLAVGSLSASALFHLIPQAFGLLGQDNYHNYLWKSLIIFVGIYVFFITERCMKIIIQRKQKKKQKKALRNVDTASLTLSPSDLSSNGGEKINHDVNTPDVFIECGKKNGDAHQAVETDPDTQVCLRETENTQSHHGHSHFQSSTNSSGKQEIATVAWMIIFGDGLHNFIDGLSMGAAFSDSILSGVSISVAVICEEFPHELGDFAVLLSAGMTMKQALMYNFLSACTCYLGLIFGIILGDISDGGQYIFAFAGGMFLYISLVDMVNELSEALENASGKGTLEMLRVFGLQNIGIIIGVTVMFVMARYSENINFNLGDL